MEMLLDGFRDWLLAYGTAGALAWIVLKILAIAINAPAADPSCR